MKTHHMIAILGSLLIASSCSQDNRPNSTAGRYVRKSISTTPIQDSIYLNEEHREWQEAVRKSKEIAARSPAKATDMYWTILKTASDGMQPSVKPDFPDHSSCIYTDLIDGMKTAGYLCQNIFSLTDFLNTNPALKEVPDIERNLESYAERLLDNFSYRKILTATYPYSPEDCKMNAITAAALYIGYAANHEGSSAQKIPIHVVLGLVYDETYAPNGFGHSWATLNGKIIDPAIDKQMSPENYVPIVGVSLSFNPSDRRCSMSPRVYCLTPDMMSKLD